MSDVLTLKCGHRCRADPVEATTYSLEAKGEELMKFRSNAAAELTVEEQDKEQKKTYDMEVVINVPRDDVARVRNYIHFSISKLVVK